MRLLILLVFNQYGLACKYGIDNYYEYITGRRRIF